MTHYLSTSPIDLPRLTQYGCSRDSKHPSNRQYSSLIHILDDYSLLYIFSLSRQTLLDESEADILGSEADISGRGEWKRERWWYRLVQVCRRWRYIVLESTSHLRLSLVCARGTPVADMLAHSPPLPLIIDHLDQNHEITTEDEEGIIFALQHRDRVRRIRLRKSVPILQKLINSLDGEFPILEYLFIKHQRYQRPRTAHNVNLKFPETFRAPHLRHLMLMNFAIPIGSPSLTSMGNLVTLSLNLIPQSAYFHPNALLQRLLLMPQLEIFGITFNAFYPSGNVERQLLGAPIMMDVTLPNLRWLAFQGASAYLEALLPRLTIPLLEKLQLYFFNQLTYSIPHLQQFMSTAESLRHNTITLTFREDILNVTAHPYKGAGMYTLEMEFGCEYLNRQIASAAQVFHPLMFSAVEHLILENDRRFVSSEWSSEAERTQWRELLGSFGNAKTLHVDRRLIKPLSRALRPGEGESPMEVLPELQELSYSAFFASRNAFTLFIDARRKVGRPVTVVRS